VFCATAAAVTSRTTIAGRIFFVIAERIIFSAEAATAIPIRKIRTAVWHAVPQNKL
jgi:hypothetical protein